MYKLVINVFNNRGEIKVIRSKYEDLRVAEANARLAAEDDDFLEARILKKENGSWTTIWGKRQ